MYIVSVGKPTFTMILNQMMDTLWQTAAVVANSTTRSDNDRHSDNEEKK